VKKDEILPLRRPFADPSHKLRASAQGFGSGSDDVLSKAKG